MSLNRLAASAAASVLVFGAIAVADDHFDIAPYLIDGQLKTGGLTHSGGTGAPPIQVFGYEFGEDAYDPYNATDPGVNQAVGVGSLPEGAAVRYNLLGGLRFWDGTGDVNFTDPGSALISISMRGVSRTLTGSSGAQAGSLIQSVAAGGAMHEHFLTSLFAASGTSNVLGEANYQAPPEGIYAWNMNLTLANGGTTYTSEPIWIIFNNGLTEQQHGAAIDYVQSSYVPEPAGLAVLAIGGMLSLRHRRKD